MTDEKKLPRGRLSRLARLARVGAQTGVTLLRSRNDASTDAARAAAVLGQLRGVATKLGQMVSYVDGVIPEEHREAYEKGMARLQSATPSSPPDAIAALLREELGDDLDALFETFETEPIASASIGQVHRATLKDGRRVAVKIQHPGIAEALEADLKNAKLMELAFGMMGGRKFESKRLLAELRERFNEELDYTLEARRQTIFAEIHKGDPQIRIPAVIDSHSTSRVLTTEFADGVPFEEAAAAPEAQRKLWAEILWRFVYKANLVGGLFNADPRPGNYLFTEGAIWFLDFGCVQPIPEHRRGCAANMHSAINVGDVETFHKNARAMLQLDGGRYEELALAYIDESFRPLSESPFHITRDYSAALVEQFKAMTFELMKGGKGDSYVPMPRGVLFINRLQFGFYSVLARLDVEADYAATESAFLEMAHQPYDRPWQRGLNE